MRIERLGPQHAQQLLAGQDEALAAEIIGRSWTPETLDAFLARTALWRADGPFREFAAVAAGAPVPTLLGGGGLALLGPGLERGEAALTYWLLRAHRSRGHGRRLAAALVDIARADARIDHLVLRIAPDNEASKAVAAALGARGTGIEERHPADVHRRVQRWVLDLRAESSGT